MRKSNLTVTLYVGGKQVEHLTPEQTNRIAEKLTEAMSLYYTAHPKEYQELQGFKRERRMPIVS
jgi:hypothetical protein